MSLKDYIAEEIAVDHADGLLTRREALRRLALLGLGAAASTSLLAACARSADDATTSPAPGGTASPTPEVPKGVATEAITFPGEGRTLSGAWAAPAEATGGVLVIHENRGLNDHIRAVAGRLAADGYGALAIDLLSAEGGSDGFDDPAQATAALAAAAPERFVSDMRAGLDELERRLPGAALAAVGFCFGGGLVWQLLDAGDARLAAAVPFYGPIPTEPDFSGSTAAVLAIYAEKDARVNAGRDRAEAALKDAGLTHELVTFPGVDHAFFNDTGPRYSAVAAEAAYRRVLDWFGKHLSA